MQSNIARYMKFQSQERPSINKNHRITFPKVTLCLNSMHSKQALDLYPSHQANFSTEELLEYYYIGGGDIEWVREFGVFDGLDQYDMADFHNDTAAVFTIDDCQFGNIGNTCRKSYSTSQTF